MKYLVTIAVVAIGSSLMLSCGASKKLVAANAENAKLNALVSDQTSKLTASSNEIAHLKTQNMQYSKDIADCRASDDVKEKKLAAMRAYKQGLQEKFDSIKAIFDGSGAEVTFENGQVHVNFPDAYFFASNSYAVGQRGRLALNMVADVMRDNPDAQCIIEGNTDTLHVNGKADNWSLSTERSLSVIRILQYTYNINPHRLTAAGRGKFNPIADNSTPEGREKNRRVEIIVYPPLYKIWDMLSIH